MRNPGGKGFSRLLRVCFRKGRRERRAAEKFQLKSACSRQEPLPWSPKESLSPPGSGLHTKLGVGQFIIDKKTRKWVAWRSEKYPLLIIPR